MGDGYIEREIEIEIPLHHFEYLFQQKYYCYKWDVITHKLHPPPFHAYSYIIQIYLSFIYF